MSTDTIDRDTRDAVSDVLIRYATGIDSKDWGLLATCFTADVEANYGDDIGVWNDVDGIVEWMRVVHEACGHTLHRITNIAITPAGPGRVTARAYVDAIVLGPDNASGAHATGFYDDELIETPDGWRISRRTFTTVLVEGIG